MFAHVMPQRWIMGLVVTASAALVLSGCGGGAGSTEQQQRSPSETTQQTSGAEGRFSAANLKELDGTIAGVMSDKNLPGVLVAVSVPTEGEYLSAQGKANLDTGRAPDPAEDRFRIGSVTKTFVATAILRLVDEGKANRTRCPNGTPTFRTPTRSP